MPRLTFARMGLSFVSNASSVIEKSVMRTGTMRDALQTNSIERLFHRQDLEHSRRGEGVVREELRRRRIEDHLQRGELGEDAGLHTVAPGLATSS